MKKSSRGELDYCNDGNDYYCRWSGNLTVKTGSNFGTHFPVHEAKRRIKKNPDSKINQTNLIKKYNQGIGGVNAIDDIGHSY